jgi:type IV secretion system protein VirB9
MHRTDWTWLAIASGVAIAAGCATSPALGPEDFVEASRVEEQIAVAEPPAPPADTTALLGDDDAELAAAVRKFQETGKAPVVRKPGFVVFPYGERQPILYCKPLRICDIELEAGEGVLNIALGDSERWIASKMESGPEDGRRAHVVVKPTEFDLSTNLVITTDRRVYHLGLISTLEEDDGYFRSVRFYYPQDTVQRWSDAADAAREGARREREREVAQLPLVSPEGLNFGYRIDGDRVPWRPVQAFDDGTRVFIQMPGAMSATEAPALFVVTGEKDQALVNYRLRGRYFVVDKLFAEASLVLGVGRKQERVTVSRLSRDSRQ